MEFLITATECHVPYGIITVLPVIRDK